MVIPAKAGIQSATGGWIPAYTGMTRQSDVRDWRFDQSVAYYRRVQLPKTARGFAMRFHILFVAVSFR